MIDGVGQQSLSDSVDQWDAAGYLKKRVPQAQYNRRAFDRNFYRNCLFYVGLQWLRYSRTNQQWRPISLPDWFPKNVSNKFAVCCDDMKSVFMQSKPESVFAPVDAEAAADVAASRAAKSISALIDKDVNQADLESMLATWLVLTGSGFVVDGFDNDKKHGMKFMPDYMCVRCIRHVPAPEATSGCPHCGSFDLMEARGEDGYAIGKEYPVGKIYSEVAGPFEIHMDLVAESLDKSPYVYRARTYPIEMLKDMFLDFADKIKPDDAGVDSGMFYQTALAYVINGTASSAGNYAGSAGSADNTPRATLYHLWVRPTEQMPNGGEALVCGNSVLWKSEMSYRDQDGTPILPVTQFGFNRVPGRVFAKTPADDLVPKQVQINKLNAFIQLSLERNANGTWLLPKGIGLDEISGEPGEKVWYNAFNGIKPERLPGLDIPGAVFRYVAQLEADMKQISHTEDVLHGKAPEGVPTLGATQLLLERGFAGFSDGLASWGAGWNAVRTKRLMIWRDYVSESQTMTVLGKNKEWESQKFSSDDMKGRVSVLLEQASVAPKSKAYKQLTTAQLFNVPGAIDLNDPAVRMSVLTLFDASDLLGALDADMLDAEKEKEEFLRSGQPRPRKGIDNDMIHSAEHKKVAKSDEFKHWPPQLQQIWLDHIINFHDANIAEQQEAAAQRDPHIMNAKAKMMEMQAELQALQKGKDIELAHVAQRKQIDLHAHGLKKGIDAVLDAKRRAAQASQKNGA